MKNINPLHLITTSDARPSLTTTLLHASMPTVISPSGGRAFQISTPPMLRTPAISFADEEDTPNQEANPRLSLFARWQKRKKGKEPEFCKTCGEREDFCIC